MSAETKKVLEMLAEGKITTEQAERLLDKLPATADATAAEKTETEAGAAAGRKRFLRIVVERPDGKDVNVRVPLDLARTGMMLGAVLPARVLSQLAEHGIDLSQLKGEGLIDALPELNVDVQKPNGKKVRIFCE